MDACRHSLGVLAEAACLFEARARKPGNVHPGAAFTDMTYDDFARSAATIRPIFDRAASLTVGQLVLEGVQATRSVHGKNTNLGILLVLAPLAKAEHPTQSALKTVLASLTQHDAVLVYEAIRLAQPGGLGQTAEQDVHEFPTVTLREAMRLAADRDLIARQYASSYHDLFTQLLPILETGLADHAPLEQAIIQTHLTSIAILRDTLILRKCGQAIAEEAQRRAQQVLEAGWPVSETGCAAVRNFDRWLRADGHRRNPGTTADLIAGVLFLSLRRGSIELPLQTPWECPAL
jgi:triphosphoribosyl-dephospho-CoA synthase